MLKPDCVVKPVLWDFGWLWISTAKQSKNQWLAEWLWKEPTKDGDSPVGENG
jgi:hypothetical protein